MQPGAAMKKPIKQKSPPRILPLPTLAKVTGGRSTPPGTPESSDWGEPLALAMDDWEAPVV